MQECCSGSAVYAEEREKLQTGTMQNPKRCELITVDQQVYTFHGQLWQWTLCSLGTKKNCTDWLSLFKKKGHVRYCNHPCKYIMCIASVSGHRVSIWRIGLRYSVTPTLISTRASTGACDHLIAIWTELWFVILYSLLNMTATRTDDRFISPSVKM